MAKTLHTPGPWSVVNHSWEHTSVYANQKLIASVAIDSSVTEETQEECESVVEANARLIVATPDILEALQKLVKACSENHWENNKPIPAELIVLGMDALTKATQ